MKAKPTVPLPFLAYSLLLLDTGESFQPSLVPNLVQVKRHQTSPQIRINAVHHNGRKGIQSNALFSSNTATANDDESLIPEQTKDVKKRLSREFFTIAFPALIQLAAEPLAGLVDTAYLGRLGPDVLGGAGVAISAQVSFQRKKSFE